MVGSMYWSTGITVTWNEPHGAHSRGVGAELTFQDSGFCDSRSTEGVLRARYVIEDLSLAQVLDMLIEDAGKLGIVFGVGSVGPTLYAEHDGKGDPAEHYYPANWRERLAKEAARIGWGGPALPPFTATEARCA